MPRGEEQTEGLSSYSLFNYRQLSRRVVVEDSLEIQLSRCQQEIQLRQTERAELIKCRHETLEILWKAHNGLNQQEKEVNAELLTLKKDKQVKKTGVTNVARKMENINKWFKQINSIREENNQKINEHIKQCDVALEVVENKLAELQQKKSQLEQRQAGRSHRIQPSLAHAQTGR